MTSRSIEGLPVFFDLDGTLADSAGGIIASLEHALAACDLRGTAIDWQRHIGPPLQRMLETALPGLAAAHRDQIVASYREHYAATGVFMTTLFAGIAEVMQKVVDRGATVYVVTNKPQPLAEAVVEHLGLARLVRRVVGGDPGGLGNKPDRAAALVADKGLSGGVFVGDGLDDLRAAERIGAKFVLAGWGYGVAGVLAERPCVACVEQPGDLLVAIETGLAGR